MRIRDRKKVRLVVRMTSLLSWMKLLRIVVMAMWKITAMPSMSMLGRMIYWAWRVDLMKWAR